MRTAVLLSATLVLAACTGISEPPDPEKIRQQIAEYRAQELELVHATIADPDRADRFVALIAERDRLIAESTAAINRYRDRMTALNADYHAEREKFESLLTDFNGQRERAQARFVAVIGQMKAETTAAEWKQIARFQTTRLNPRKLIYGGSAEGG